MNVTLRKEILGETYKDMEKLILKVTWRFHSNYGGDIDDLTGQANLLFIHALDEYDESYNTKLSTWLWTYINKGLWNYVTTQKRHKHISIDDEEININLQSSNPIFNSFSIIEMLDELEQDTLLIIRLFLETPNELIASVIDNGKQMNHIQGYMRRRLRNRLKQLGWSLKRVTEAFEKIKEAVQY